MTALLRNCPECGGQWPSGPDHALRGCGWLQGLSRGISPSNNDIQIHDGVQGRNRFLHLEIKTAREGAPQKGQLWLLTALAGQGNWTVLVVKGDARRLMVHRVTRDGLDGGVASHVEALRRAIDLWLGGALWRDAAAALSSTPDGHTHGWARVAGTWTCVQDFYAVGKSPETSCGATASEYA